MVNSNIICLFGQNCGKTKQVWSKTCLKEIVSVYSKSEEDSRQRETVQSNFLWGMGPQVLSDTVDVMELVEEHSSSDSTPDEEPKCGTCGDNKDKPIIMKTKCWDCGCRKCGDTDESKG